MTRESNVEQGTIDDYEFWTPQAGSQRALEAAQTSGTALAEAPIAVDTKLVQDSSPNLPEDSLNTEEQSHTRHPKWKPGLLSTFAISMAALPALAIYYNDAKTMCKDSYRISSEWGFRVGLNAQSKDELSLWLRLTDFDKYPSLHPDENDLLKVDPICEGFDKAPLSRAGAAIGMLNSVISNHPPLRVQAVPGGEDGSQ